MHRRIEVGETSMSHARIERLESDMMSLSHTDPDSRIHV